MTHREGPPVGVRKPESGSSQARGAVAGRIGRTRQIATSYLSDLERGKQSPTLDVLNRIVRALDATPTEFFSPFNQAYRVRFRKHRYDTPTTTTPWEPAEAAGGGGVL
jgi:transcriptional regulator with XRE-family HTH domain